MFAFLGPLIGAIVAGFSRLFATRIGGWVAMAMIALGLSWVTTEAVMTPVIGMVSSAAGGLPATIAQWLGVLNMDKYISIVLSAYAAGGIKRAVLARRSP